jgi:hypothetical protein
MHLMRFFMRVKFVSKKANSNASIIFLSSTLRTVRMCFFTCEMKIAFEAISANKKN